MQSLTAALSDQLVSGGCNEGFIRDDAILVVTFITDEEDTRSDGTPDAWRQIVLDAKGGNEEGVVVIGIFGDNDLQDPVCTELEGSTGAFAAPRLRQFLDSFGDHGFFCSVCAPDYSQCFADAVRIIDSTCKSYIPVV